MEPLAAAELLEKFPVDQLQQASTFGALSAETVEWLVSEGQITRRTAGESLFEPGQRGDSFFVILQGEVALYNFDGSQYAHIRDYQKGQQIGFVSTIALHDRIGKAVATTETLTLEIDSRLFYRLHKEFPADFGLIMLNLAREMARTVGAMGNTIANLKAGKTAP